MCVCYPQPLFTCIHMHGRTHLKLNMPAALLLYNSITNLHGEKATPPPKRFNPVYSFFQKTQPAILHSTPLCSLVALHLFMQCGGGNILNSSGLNDTRRSEWGKFHKKPLKCVYILYVKTTRTVVRVAQAIYIL